MSSDRGAEKPRPQRIVKWSPPYRRENVEQPEFDLVEIEREGPIGRIVLNSPEKRNPLGYERLLQIEMAAKLLELAGSYGEPAPDGAGTRIAISQEELGNLVGTSRVSVNQQLKAWQREGVLRTARGRVTLLDLDRLRSVAG